MPRNIYEASKEPLPIEGSLHMKKMAIALAMLLVLLPSSPIGANITDFEGGAKEIIANLYSPSYEATVNINVPVEYYLADAMMSVSGLPAEYNSSAYPEAVAVKLNDTVIWNFQGNGYGSMGKQYLFSSGANEAKVQFGEAGGINNINIKLPKSAIITSASTELQGLPFIKGEYAMKFSGINKDSLFGHTIANAGDLNKDGFDDIIIGAPDIDPSQDAGDAYIYYGALNMDNSIDLNLSGNQINDHFGYSVSGAGDVNGDGNKDVIVGALGYDIIGMDTGRAYLYYGGQNMDNISDITFTGENDDSHLGGSVSWAGDINSDGYDDLIIGSTHANSSIADSGRAYIYFGGQNMNNIPDAVLNGSASGDRFGCSVSNAGDVNNDGFDDVIVGAYDNDTGGNHAGQAYIYFGGKNMDGNADIIFTGAAANNWLGYSVSTARDINKDGFDDVIVGAPSSNGQQTGLAYLFLGGKNMDNISDVNFIGAVAGDYFGGSVSDAGDLNGDDYNDILVGTMYNNRAYVYFGAQQTDSLADAIVTGYNSFGEEVACAGDINNDGADDILIGAITNYTAGVRTGAAFVYSLNQTVPQGILDITISIESTTIWQRSGLFNGTSQITDFAQALNKYLGAATSDETDAYDNSFVYVPLKIATKNGGNITFFNLSITYQYNATIPNFSTALNGYLTTHQNEKDGNGNITVPIKISSTTAGRIKLSNLNLKRDIAPALVKEIKTAELDEDSSNLTLIDLYTYFQDDADVDTALNFSVVSSTNSSMVKLWISGKRYLSADAETGDANDNWTGTVEAIVACSDHWGQKTESNKFSIIVRNVNDPPIITSSPGLRADPGTPYFYNITAIDGDNDSIQFSLQKAPPNMTIDAKTGAIQWMPRARGYFEVNILASDGNGTDHQNYFITAGNNVPKITSGPQLNATTGIPYYYNVTAEDLNLDPLTFSLISDIIGIQINASTGAITWTPTDPGNFDIKVIVSDGKLKAEQNFTVNVVQGNGAPKFVSKAITTAVVGIPYLFTAKAVDDDGDTVIYSLSNGPTGMTIGGGNGIITWTPGSVGNYSLTVIASDGKGGEARQELTIVVSEKVKTKVEISRPVENEKVKGKVIVAGTALKGTLEVVAVQVKVDDGPWTNASGTSSWEFSLDASKMKNGAHSLAARAFDGTDYSDPASRTFSVDNKAQNTSKGFIPGLEGLMVVTVMALILATSQFRRKK